MKKSTSYAFIKGISTVFSILLLCCFSLQSAAQVENPITNQGHGNVVTDEIVIGPPCDFTG